MELTPLKYFVKLADVLSFTEASKELFITQSTLSLSIKQLEEELGVTLFDRIGKKIYLTDAGRDFLDCSRKAIEEVAYGVQHLKEMQHVYTGKIKIGVIYSLFPLLNHLRVESLRRLSLKRNCRLCIPIPYWNWWS